MTFGYYIGFKAITSNDNNDILCNLSKERDEVLEIQDNYILKDLKSSTTELEDKRLYCGIGNQM